MRQLVVVKRVAKSGCGKTGRLLGICGVWRTQYSIQKWSAGDRRTPGILAVYAMGGTCVRRYSLYGENSQYADVGGAEDSKLRGRILQPVLAARGFGTAF